MPLTPLSVFVKDEPLNKRIIDQFRSSCLYYTTLKSKSQAVLQYFYCYIHNTLIVKVQDKIIEKCLGKKLTK